MGADDLESMLLSLASHPADSDLRKRTAEALDAQGKPDKVDLILAGFVNLTGHDDDTGLPCLCKACLPAAPEKAEHEGMKFTRSFAIAGSRVLHYWQLSDQDRAAVRASVTERLRGRLRRIK